MSFLLCYLADGISIIQAFALMLLHLLSLMNFVNATLAGAIFAEEIS